MVGKYTINFKFFKNDGEIFTHTGTAEIFQSKAFKYGNGLALTITSFWNGSTSPQIENYDLRYYPVGDNANDFFKRFLADTYNNGTFKDLTVIKND